MAMAFVISALYVAIYGASFLLISAEAWKSAMVSIAVAITLVVITSLGRGRSLSFKLLYFAAAAGMAFGSTAIQLYAVGGLFAVFALLTLADADEPAFQGWKNRLMRACAALTAAAMAALPFYLPAWTVLGTSVGYLLLAVIFWLLPIGLAALSGMKDD